MASTMLTGSWLKFIDKLLFPACVAICIKIFNTGVFHSAESDPYNMYLCVLCSKYNILHLVVIQI